MADGDLFEIIAPSDVTLFCAGHAEAIRVLGRRVVGDIIEIGNRLIAVRDALPDQQFSDWLREEFNGWSRASVYNFISAAEAFSGCLTIGQLNIDAGALYLLAGPAIPEAAREAAIEKAQAGERLTKAEAQRLVADARAAERGAIEEKLGLLNAQIAGLQSAVANAAQDANAQTERLARHAAKELAKLQADRDRLQMERDGARETARKLLAEPPIPAAKSKLDSTKSFRSMCVLQGIEALHKELRIPATDVVGAHFETCDLSTEPPAQRLHPAMRQAREISAWLADFLTECERR